MNIAEALNIYGPEIEDAPSFGTRLDTGYILGMAKTEGRVEVKILLHIDRVLTGENYSCIRNAAWRTAPTGVAATFKGRVLK